MKMVGKIILAIAIGFIGLFGSYFIGGRLVAALEVAFRLSPHSVEILGWILPQVIFLGPLIVIYIYIECKGNGRAADRKS
jgi:hypothetical protein